MSNQAEFYQKEIAKLYDEGNKYLKTINEKLHYVRDTLRHGWTLNEDYNEEMRSYLKPKEKELEGENTKQCFFEDIARFLCYVESNETVKFEGIEKDEIITKLKELQRFLKVDE